MTPVLRNLLGIAASYAFVAALMAAATVLLRRRVLGAPVTRKVVHIGVAHWWFIATALIDDPWAASIGPATFVVINALAIRLRVLPAMDEGTREHNWGTVWFPVSLLVMVNLCWRGVLPAWVGGIGILVLGWGDGLAALVGGVLPVPGCTAWGGRKSLAGTAVMFAASFLVTLAFTLACNARLAGAWGGAVAAAAATAAIATAVEAVTPLGIDNLTVPFAASFSYAALFL